MAIEAYGGLDKHQAKAVVIMGQWNNPRLSTRQIAKRLRIAEFEVYNLLAKERGELTND